ncbi:hypothetical protein JHK86_050893 [Glycine max]|nr:hypothetical protein JHK86_050893 [Glycine max]
MAAIRNKLSYFYSYRGGNSKVNKVKESIDLINSDKKEGVVLSKRSLSMYGVYGGLDNMHIDNRLYMVKYDFEDNKEKEVDDAGNMVANLPPLSSSSLFQPKLIPSKSYPPFKNEGLSKASANQRKSCKTHCLSTSCDHHPDEKFIGICPKCLYERLAIPKQKPSSFVSNAPTSSIVIVAHKPIFQPFATKHI